MKTKTLVFAVLTLFLSFCFPLNLWAQEEQEEEVLQLSLEKAIEIALVNDPQVKVNEINIQVAEHELKKAEDDAKDIKRGINKVDEMLGSMPPTSAAQLLPYSGLTYETALAIELVPETKRVALDMAKRSAELYKNTVRLSVESSYYDLLQKEDELQLKKKAVSLAEEDLKATEIKVKGGIAIPLEVTAKLNTLNQKKEELKTAEENYDLAQKNFKKLLGLPSDSKIVLTDTFSFEPIEIDIEKEIADLKANDLEYIGAQNQVKLAELTLEQAKRFYTPNVNAYKEAVFNLEEAQQNLAQVESGLSPKVENAAQSLKDLESNYAILENSLRVLEKQIQNMEIMRQVRMVTALQLEQQKFTLEETRANLTKLIYAYNLTAKQFEYDLYSTGTGSSPAATSTSAPSSSLSQMSSSQ